MPPCAQCGRSVTYTVFALVLQTLEIRSGTEETRDIFRSYDKTEINKEATIRQYFLSAPPAPLLTPLPI
jgi:hypothetical protein